MKNTFRTFLILSLMFLVSGIEFATRSGARHEANALATLTVNTLTDTNDGICNAADCSLREAVAAAASGDTIIFSVTGTIVLGGTRIEIAKDLSIIGPGAGSISVSGNNTSQVFNMPTAHAITLDGIGITGGNVPGGGGAMQISGGGGSIVTIRNCLISGNTSTGGAGGGILNNGTLNIINSVIFGNSTPSHGGGIANTNGALTVTNSTLSGNQAGTVSVPSFGGAISNIGSGAPSTVSIVNSTISGNTAQSGAGLYNFRAGAATGVTVTITNSTFSGNTSTFNGSAIYNDGGNVNLTNATITNNTAGSTSTAVASFSGGPTTTNVRNTIIAANSNNLDANGTFVSFGYNLIGNADQATGFTATGDQTGTAAAPLDPMLGPLANNGGPTETHALISGSTAIDKGSAAVTTDQRGTIRPVDNPMIPNATGGDGSDIGSFELQAPTAANVQVSGRVVTTAGRGIAKVHITLVDSSGAIRSALSNAFGYYKFDDLEGGETYLLTVRSKRYVFANPSQVVTVFDSLTGVDFTAFP